MRRADRLLDRAEGAGVRDGGPCGMAWREALCLDATLDPQPGAVNDHEIHPQAVQQREIVDDTVKPRIVDRFPVDLDHEGPPAMGVDVGRGAAEPLHEAHRAASRAGIVHRTLHVRSRNWAIIGTVGRTRRSCRGRPARFEGSS